VPIRIDDAVADNLMQSGRGSRSPRGSRDSEAPNLSSGRSVLRCLTGLLSGVLQAVARPSRILDPPGGMTSLPGASSKSRFLLGTPYLSTSRDSCKDTVAAISSPCEKYHN